MSFMCAFLDPYLISTCLTVVVHIKHLVVNCKTLACVVVELKDGLQTFHHNIKGHKVIVLYDPISLHYS